MSCKTLMVPWLFAPSNTSLSFLQATADTNSLEVEVEGALANGVSGGGASPESNESPPRKPCCTTSNLEIIIVQ